MLVLTFVVSIVVGLVRGGNLAKLSVSRLDGYFILFLGVAIRAILSLNISEGLSNWYIWVLQGVSHTCLLIAVWSNIRLPGFKLIFAGLICNTIVILANQGRMPVSREALITSGQEEAIGGLLAGSSPTHQLLQGTTTRLPWLADIFALPAWWPLAVAFSIGDVLIALGVFIFIQHQMGAGRRRDPVLQ